MIPAKPRKLARTLSLFTVSAVAATMAITGAVGIGAAQAADNIVSPEVQRTRSAPTGYEVTFRLYAPDAESVKIKGEWSFASPADIVADATNPNAREGATWQVGDIPINSPLAGSASNWPVHEMTKDEQTGVWEYTTPLPSGTFSYWFYQDCDAQPPLMSGCTPQGDPQNPPYTTVGSAENTSQVYVPSDPAFGTEDVSWQAPVAPQLQGRFVHVTYSSPGHVNPDGKNYATVFLPNGYDQYRTEPYPVFFLNHGGGGTEMNWATQGTINNIADNLLADGLIEPTVIVLPNNPTTDDVLNSLVPYINSHFNVDPTPQNRMFAGLSGGGTVVQDILYHYTTNFGYYGVWSVPRGLPTEGEEKNPELKQLKGIHVAIGTQDLGGLAQGNTTATQQLLAEAQVPFTAYNADGAHTWEFWRRAARDFLTRVVYPELQPSAPLVTKQPAANSSVARGTSITLTAAASGAPAPTIQWQRSLDSGKTWANIVGATQSELDVTVTTDGERYRAVFTNTQGTATSVAATIRIKAAAGPAPAAKPAAKTASKTTVTLAKKKIKAGVRVKATVKVTPAKSAQGTITVKVGKKTITKKIGAKKLGKISVKLPKLTKGNYKVKASFTGNSTLKASSSKTVPLKVIKKK